MSGPTLPGFYRVSCPCGAQLKVDPLREDRRVTCPSCKETSDFIVTMDAHHKQPRVSIVVPTKALFAADSLKSAKASKGESHKQTLTGAVVTCPCGAPLPVDPDELAEVAACGECGKVYHVVLKIDPETKRKVAILIEKETSGGGRKAHPAPRGTKTGRMKTQIFEEIKPTRVKARNTVAAPPGTQAVTCPCGQTIYVKRREIGKTMPCPSCGQELQLEESRDPQTLAPTVIARRAPPQKK